MGVPPTLVELEKLLADTRKSKRELLVDKLLGRTEFTEIWAKLLQIRTFNKNGQQVPSKAVLNYYPWLSERIAGNMPFNELVQQLLSAKGGTFSSPATNYFQSEADGLKPTENVAQVFIGICIQCAQGHNHPFNRWAMDDYYRFASFFARVKRKPAEESMVFQKRRQHRLGVF